jgi:hypothetical protein
MKKNFKKIKFFSFLYIDKKVERLNFKNQDFEDRYSIYLKNAALLNLAIHDCGYEFVILTNNKSYILKKIKKEFMNAISIIEIAFPLKVSKSMHFYCCHYRVDIFKYLSKLKNTSSILLDLDVVILKNLKKINYKIFENCGVVHDISSNIFPAYGFKKIKENLQMLMGYKVKNPRWYGGDFIGGSEKFFQILHSLTKKYQSKFTKLKKKFPSYTDEFFLTAAILDIKKNIKYKIVDGCHLRVWSRYWSINTIHKQMNIKKYFNFYMLHLPADKEFIAKFYDKLRLSKDFKIAYIEKISSFSHILKNLMKKFFRVLLINFFLLNKKNFFFFLKIFF